MNKILLQIFLSTYSFLWSIVLLTLRFFPKNSKASRWDRLHKSEKNVSTVPKSKPHLLFTCSSVGEYKRIETLARHYLSTGYHIEISFFSPSGYQFLLNELSEWSELSMLPFDRKQDVDPFLNSRNLHYVFCSSNMIWPNLLLGLDLRNIPYSVVGCSYCSTSLIQKLSRRFRLSFLKSAVYIFCIDQDTKVILSEYLNPDHLVVTGEPRLSSILALEAKGTGLDHDIIQRYKEGHQLLIIGSAYNTEVAIILDTYEILVHEGYKIIIAPHNLDQISDIVASLKSSNRKYGLYSQGQSDCKILILDTMGMLQSAYGHAEIAFIGGGWRKGIHNIVEAIYHDCTIISGPKTQKFPEARYFKKRDVLLTISNSNEMKDILEKEKSQDFQSKKRSVYSDWITENKDANRKMIQILNLGSPNL